MIDLYNKYPKYNAWNEYYEQQAMTVNTFSSVFFKSILIKFLVV